MNAKKSLFVTIVCTLMLMAIIVGTMLYEPVGFEIMVGILAFYGLFKLVVYFYYWLQEPGKPDEIEDVEAEPVEDDVNLTDEYTNDFDSIMEEVKKQ